MNHLSRLGAAACALLLLPGCGTFPQDPDRTLEHVDQQHVLRVGVSHAPPLVDTSSGTPTGREIELVTSFAQSRGARPEWTLGGEEELVARLEEGELDVVVGGITKQTPWSSKAAVTRPWGKAPDPSGKERDRVFLAPLGENALVGALERHLDEEAGR